MKFFLFYILCATTLSINASAQLVDINIQDENGNTALHRAVMEQNRSKISDLLNNSNISLAIQNKSYATPIDLAKQLRDGDIILTALRRRQADNTFPRRRDVINMNLDRLQNNNVNSIHNSTITLVIHTVDLNSSIQDIKK